MTELDIIIIQMLWEFFSEGEIKNVSMWDIFLALV